MLISFADAFSLRGGTISISDGKLSLSEIKHLTPPAKKCRKEVNTQWILIYFCCSWEPGKQIRLHHPLRGMRLQDFCYFLKNTHPLAAFGQTFCSLRALGNLSVTHLWQGNPRLVGEAWESSRWFMDSENECPLLSCLKFSLHICPLFSEIMEKPCIKRSFRVSWWFSWLSDKQGRERFAKWLKCKFRQSKIMMWWEKRWHSLLWRDRTGSVLHVSG